VCGFENGRVEVFDWDDLRYFLAVARRRSMRAAAKTLGVNQTTVRRRLEALERDVGQALIKPCIGGFVLTSQGQNLLSVARQMEVAAGDVQRRIAALGNSAHGQVRVASPVALCQRIVRSGFVDRFTAANPGITVEMVLSQHLVDVANGEADVEIRGGAAGDTPLVVKKVAELPWAIFASKAFIKHHGRPSAPEEIANYNIILLDDIAQLPAAVWLRSHASKAKIVARCDNIASVYRSVKAGTGLAPLPIAYASKDSDLVRVMGPLSAMNYPIYLVVHKDMCKVRRVKAFLTYCVRELKTVFLNG
jgi:DNA-binding transcriptional LysR family regulator